MQHNVAVEDYETGKDFCADKKRHLRLGILFENYCLEKVLLGEKGVQTLGKTYHLVGVFIVFKEDVLKQVTYLA